MRYLTLLLLFIGSLSFAQDADSVISWRRNSVFGVTGAALVAGYGLQNNMWWHRDISAFHFDWDNDWTYALGADKAGHIFFPNLVANTYTDILQWCGYSAKHSVYYASIFALSYETFIELRDGFSKQWGFSWGDFSADLIGTGLPVLQYHYPELKNFQLKISYYPSERFRNNSHRYIIDDYESAYHWLSINIHNFAPEEWRQYIPKWINLAVGHCVENLDIPGAGKHRIYLSLDWNLESIKQGDDLLSKILRFLNHYHLPAPAVRILPSVIWYGVKF